MIDISYLQFLNYYYFQNFLLPLLWRFLRWLVFLFFLKPVWGYFFSSLIFAAPRWAVFLPALFRARMKVRSTLKKFDIKCLFEIYKNIPSWVNLYFNAGLISSRLIVLSVLPRRLSEEKYHFEFYFLYEFPNRLPVAYFFSNVCGEITQNVLLKLQEILRRTFASPNWHDLTPTLAALDIAHTGVIY